MTEYDPSLARLVITLMNAQEQEWARVSRVLHDDVGQVMSAIGLQLDVLRIDIQERFPEIKNRTAEIQELLERAISLVRELSYELNPAVVEKAGLQFALERLAGRYRKRFSGTLRLMVDLTKFLPPEVASALYRIAQQAIDNAILHSGSQHIEVLLRPGHLGTVLEVKDDGVGFRLGDVQGSPPGLGLLMMEYCATHANIDLSVTSEPGKGTIVKAVYPSARLRRENGSTATDV